MGYRLIESYRDETDIAKETVAVHGRTFPLPCLVEDDDAIRLLLVGQDEIKVKAWVAAHTAGVQAIVRVGEQWRAMLVPHFMEHRTEHHNTASFVFPTTWSAAVVGANYVNLMDFTPQAQMVNGEFVHLHAHSEMSSLDGLSKITEMVQGAVDDNQPAIAVTDHGVCAGHPELQQVCSKMDVKPIFGMEAYFVDDRMWRPPPAPKPDDFLDQEELSRLNPSGRSAFMAAAEERFKLALEEHKKAVARGRNYYHLILWALTDEGLRNLWAASTEANREGFYYVPRLDWDTLTRLGAGVGCSTACLRGPLAGPITEGDPERAEMNMGRLLNVFDDRLYVELHTTDLPEQRTANLAMVDIAQRYGSPTIAVVDSHYPCPDDKDIHAKWLAIQTNKDVQDEADLFTSDSDYHLMSSKEVRQSLSYLPENIVAESLSNTVAVANRCTAQIIGKSSLPVFSKVGGIQRDIERLVDICISNWKRKVIGKEAPEEAYEERFEMEMQMLIDKKFCGYFLQVSEYCKHAKDNGILVGPGRGSGGGCLVAYLCDITEIDPVEADLLFGRFLTKGRTSPPDFDVDFPASKRDFMTEFVTTRWGEENVVRVGTQMRLRNRGVIQNLARVMKNTVDVSWQDLQEISKIIDAAEADKAGKGISWEDLWDQHGEVLEQYRERYPELFAYADRMVGRLKGYGKHAAGLVISTEGALIDLLPMRAVGEAKDRQMVAEFDMNMLEWLGFLKFDLLTLRNLDTVQMAIDLIAEKRGEQINVYDWKDEYKDADVWKYISDGNTLGCFQIETTAMTRLTKQFRPQSVNELADVITLVRPGPTRSGLTAQYLRRRNGEEAVSYPDPRLEQVLAKTWGCIVYQEDIMQACMVLAGYDEEEADTVRSILGKKKVEKVEEAGKKFIPACVERGMAQSDVEALWDQMAEFAKYSFNRAHAFGYAVLSYWTAWLKYHYPAEFFTALLSTVDQDRIPDFVADARRLELPVLPPDINDSQAGFTLTYAGVWQPTIRYGLEQIKKVGEGAVKSILPGQPYSSFDDFMERKGKNANAEVVRILAATGAFDSIHPNRKALERQIEWIESGESERCVFKDDTVVKMHGLPCTFAWEDEPVVIGKSGKPLKAKPLPKRCTKACRNYTAPDMIDLTDCVPYTPREIREHERETLGVYLSSTPFDDVPENIKLDCVDGQTVKDGPVGGYIVLAVITKVREHRDRNGKEMGFTTFDCMGTNVEVTVFKDEWKEYRADLHVGALCAAKLYKNERGCTLTQLVYIKEA